METTYQKVTTRADELRGLYNRMDKARDLAYQVGYELVGFDKKKVKNAISVTGNKAAVFGHTVIADLLNGQWQTVVEGDISGNDAHKIEQFLDDVYAQIDEYLLTKYSIPSLSDWLCNHVCIRGPICAEYYSWVEKDDYNMHCLPVDMRWTPFDYGENGLGWIAPITYESASSLKARFPEVNIQGKNIEVMDYWDSEKNELWIDKKLINTYPNDFGSIPFVLVFPPAGFMLRDKGFIEHEGEDIFFMIRGLNDELNRSLSIKQSLIFNVLKPGYERELPSPTGEPAVDVPASGEVLEVPPGARHMPVPTGDMNRANIMAEQELIKMIDEGAPIAPRMYTSPPSGAELLAEVEALQRLQNARVKTIKVFKEQSFRKIIDQFIKVGQGREFSLGKMGLRKSYSTVRLKDPKQYAITCTWMGENKRQKLANLAMFTAAYGRLPLRYNLANVLMAEDPDGIIRDMDIEKAQKADPALDLFAMAMSYAQQAAEVADDVKADVLKVQSKMLTERGVSLIEQRLQPAPLPEKTQVPIAEKPSGAGTQGLLPALLGRGGVA